MENTTPEVGQILVSSWGYDQTNIDFYQIVRVSEKGSVWILPMERVIKETVGFEQYQVIPGNVRYEREVTEYLGEPNANGFQLSHTVKQEIKPRRHKWNSSGYVSLTSFSGAWPWDGKPEHMTRYA
jgi:hypothetical protein